MKIPPGKGALIVWLVLSLLLPAGNTAGAQQGGGPSGGPPGGGPPGGGMTEGPTPEYDRWAFFINRDRLPQGYLGHNAERLYNALQNNNLPGSDRTAMSEAPQPIFSRDLSLPKPEPLRISSIFAFEMPPTETLYDRRSHTFQVRCRLGPVLSGDREDRSKRGFTVLSIPELDNSYSYNDARGKHIILRDYRFRDYAVAFANFSEFSPRTAAPPPVNQAAPAGPKQDVAGSNPGPVYITASFQAPPKEPEEYRDGVRLLIVGKLVEPYISSTTVHERDRGGTKGEYAAYHNYIHIRVLELWFYDFTSGKVYLKMKPKGSGA